MSEAQRMKLLIVDDDVNNLLVLCNALKSDYEVFVVKTGVSAISRAKEEKPDLILLSIIMPDISGYEILIELKETDETRHIPVILITGITEAEAEVKGFFLGAVDYIKKPFHSAVIKARIKYHLKTIRKIQKLEKLSMLDGLTGIPNRRSFDMKIEKIWGKAVLEQTPVSLLMLDVDRFKKYNDTYGHPQGDLLLQMVAAAICSALTSPEAFAARIGGEEFACILPETELADAVLSAERILKHIRSLRLPSPDNMVETRTTVSIGVYTAVPLEGEPVEVLIQKADAFLYRAKDSGRNKIIYAEGEIK